MSTPFLVKATAIVGSGGLIFGYDIGVISGTLSTLEDVFHLSPYEEGLVVSILYAGSIVGCVFGGPLCDLIGRWRTIQLQNIIFLLGAFCTGFATNISWLYLGRFLVGVASAISGLADVPYLTEIAPAQYRGLISGQYEILVALGILISFGLDVFFATFSAGWRMAFLIPGIFALAQSMGMFFLPESPKWLLSKQHYPATRQALMTMYGPEQVAFWTDLYRQHPEYEHQNSNSHNSKDVVIAIVDNSSTNIPEDMLALLQAEQQGQEGYPSQLLPEDEEIFIKSITNKLSNNSDNSKNGNNSTNNKKTWFSVLHTFFLDNLLGTPLERLVIHDYRYSIFMVVFLQILAQITGANVVRNYAPIIFEQTGTSKQLSLLLNLVLGIVKWIFTVIAVCYVEHRGRKKLLLLGSLLVTIGFALLTFVSVFSPQYNLHNRLAFIFGCIAIYAGFGIGYGPIPWILSSEMIPIGIRGRIVSYSLIASNLAQLITNFLFIPMTNGITTTGSFGIFTLLNMLTWYYVYTWLCETKHISPQEIKSLLVQQYETVSLSQSLCGCLAPNPIEKSAGFANASNKKPKEEYGLASQVEDDSVHYNATDHSDTNSNNQNEERIDAGIYQASNPLR